MQREARLGGAAGAQLGGAAGARLGGAAGARLGGAGGAAEAARFGGWELGVRRRRCPGGEGNGASVWE
ncbi:hypothetical protein ACWDG1_45730 [Streptomyces sp. NPDC001177]